MVVTGCHVEPPSVDTSTPATTVPLADVAVPETVTVLPFWTVAPDEGDVMVEVGGVVLVIDGPVTSPDISVAGCAPIMDSRLTVACCMALSVGSSSPSWLAFSPHAHWTVPASKTSAPLAARYSVRLLHSSPGPMSSLTVSKTWSASSHVFDMSISPGGRKPLSTSESHS